MVASLAPPTGDLAWPTTQACALTENQTSNQAGAQSTEAHQPGLVSSFFFFLYFRLWGREGEREGEKHHCCGCPLFAPYWGPDLARTVGMCPDWDLNRLPFASQAGAQSTEPHQPGLFHLILINLNLNGYMCLVATVSVHVWEVSA